MGNIYNKDSFYDIYFDTEFTSLSKNSQLISIGLVTESGELFYAEFNDFDKSNLDKWIVDNVVSNLLFNDDLITIQSSKCTNVFMKGSSHQISEKLNEWLKSLYEYYNHKQLRMNSDCLAYDWVLFNDLLTNGNTALDIPKHIYYIPIDLCSLLYSKNIDPDISREEFSEFTIDDYKEKINCMGIYTNTNKHNSLWDALVIKKCFNKVLSDNKLDI